MKSCSTGESEINGDTSSADEHHKTLPLCIQPFHVEATIILSDYQKSLFYKRISTTHVFLSYAYYSLLLVTYIVTIANTERSGRHTVVRFLKKVNLPPKLQIPPNKNLLLMVNAVLINICSILFFIKMARSRGNMCRRLSSSQDLFEGYR